MLAQDGESVQETKVEVGPQWFPASRWPAGRIAANYVDLTVPPRASSGIHRLSLAMRGAGVGEGTFSGFLDITMTSRVRTFDNPTVAYPKVANYGGIIELLGYDVQPGPDQLLAVGQELKLRLYWKVLREVSDSYKVFTQLLGDDQKVYGQHDYIPLDGQAPTTEWVSGEILEDSYNLTVQPGARPGKYRLIVGLYEPTKGNRIPLADGSGDALVATSFATAEPATWPSPSPTTIPSPVRLQRDRLSFNHKRFRRAWVISTGLKPANGEQANRDFLTRFATRDNCRTKPILPVSQPRSWANHT